MIVGLGVDAVEIDRVEQMLARAGDRLLVRVLCPDEMEYVKRHTSPAPMVAARLAAKEAAYKALATGTGSGIGWRDVEVVRLPSGAPTLALHGRARARFEALGARALHVTLTHSRQTAIAVVIVER